MNDKNICILFDVQELYYLPQYLPVYHEFLNRNKGNALFVFYYGKFDTIIKSIIKSENLNHVWVKNKSAANNYYKKEKADWIFLEINFHILMKFTK